MTESGRLEAIWSKEAHDGPMKVQEQATLDAGGMQEDANHGGRRPITLIEQEVFARISKEMGHEVDPIARRANLMVSGVSLAETAGRTLRVGSTLIMIRGETRPCEIMNKAYAGLRDALDPDWGGGAYGDVVEGGTVQPGDPVRWTEEEAGS